MSRPDWGRLRLQAVGIPVALIAASFAAPIAVAQTNAPPAMPARADASADQPWVSAEVVLKATEASLDQGGVRAIEPHVADLERALAESAKSFAPAAPGTCQAVVLSDGPTETLAVLALAAKNAKNGDVACKVAAVDNPYPLISLYLGSYYNEIGKNEDAVRVLDLGMKLSAAPDL